MGESRWGALVHPAVAVPTFVAAFWLFRLSPLPALPVAAAAAGLGYAAARATGRSVRGRAGWLLVWVGYAVLFGHAIGTEDTGRFGRLFFLALITTLVWAFVEDPSAFFSADDVDADEWPGEDDDEW